MTISASAANIDRLRAELAGAVGFPIHSQSQDAQPFLNYVENRATAVSSLENYLSLFIRVIEHFRRDIANTKLNSVIESFVASDSEPYFARDAPNSAARREVVTDTVFYVLGIWNASLGEFVRQAKSYRNVQLKYCINQSVSLAGSEVLVLDQTLPELISRSRLYPSPRDPLDASAMKNQDILPNLLQLLSRAQQLSTTGILEPQSIDIGILKAAILKQISTHPKAPDRPSVYDSIDLLESECIKSSTLNAHSLASIARVRIIWTFNVSRHLTLTSPRGRHELELFVLPCLLKGAPSSPLRATGMSVGLVSEILESYAILFGSPQTRRRHVRWGKLLGIQSWCWCRLCSNQRLVRDEIDRLKRSHQKDTGFPLSNRKCEFDPYLVELMNKPAVDWTREQFPCLWPRILALEECLNTAKPWSFWVLFRDRRDTLQFWTFFFGTVILFLTLSQVILAVVQTVGSF